MSWAGFNDSRIKAEVNRNLFQFQYIVLPTFLLSLILASNRSFLPRWTHLLFLFAYLVYLLYSFGTHVSHYQTGHGWIDYSMGSMLGSCIFNALHLMVLVDPLEEYRHMNDDPRTAPRTLEWKQKLYWVWCAVVSLRGVGWNYQVPGVYVQPAHTLRLKSRFCLHALQQLFLNMLLVDLAQTILQTAPFLQKFNSSFELKESIRSLPFPQRAVCVAAWFCGAYASIRLYYYFVALIFVLPGFSKPEDWPKVFGSWKDAYSVRNFWGKTWHQFIRRFCVSPGRAIVKILRVAPGSHTAALIQLFTAFFVSASMHSLGDYMLGEEYMGVSFSFFFLQPFAIVIEELVQVVARRLGLYRAARPIRSLPSKHAREWYDPNASGSSRGQFIVARALGYTWVVWWFTATAPLLIDPAMQVGVHEELIFPCSAIRSVIAVFV